MLFNSIQYLVFYPVVFFVYFLLPRKTRYIWLLVASYYFYMCWNAKYALLMLLSTVVTYAAGLGMEHAEKVCTGPRQAEKVKKGLLAASLVIDLGILFLFKYLNFAIENLNRLLKGLHIVLTAPAVDLLLPVGISFYTFQALGYTIDVYRKKTAAEKNFFQYALFVSFFPQLVAGPIERSSNLLKQIREPQEFQVQNARCGLLTMAYGLFLKMVLADNIANLIDPLFASWETQNGLTMLMAIVLFAFQIYADFNGYTQIAIGSARTLGFTLMENFDAPYLACNIQDFWRRWHISLTSWFRDYLYIPLGGNRKGKIRKYINSMVVFLCSGLWHGASWHYVIWGGLNGAFVIIHQMIAGKQREKTGKKQNKRKNLLVCWSKRLVTFFMVNFTWLFFRAEDMGSAIGILRKILTGFSLRQMVSPSMVRIFAPQNADLINLLALPVFILLIYVVDLLHEHHINAIERVLEMPLLCRWAVYLLLVMAILFCGVYGNEKSAAQFVYFQF